MLIGAIVPIFVTSLALTSFINGFWMVCVAFLVLSTETDLIFL